MGNCENMQALLQKPDFFIHVHCENVKPCALALSECFITGRKTQLGEGRGTEGGWRADGLSSRNPFSLASVILPIQLRTLHHTRCLLRSLLFSPALSFLPSVLT